MAKRKAKLKKRADQENRPRKGRECGPCFECCMFFPVKGLPGYDGFKPGGETCKWVTDNEHARCETYDSRPPVCGAYACVWLKDGETGRRVFVANERPDLIGIMFDLTPAEHVATKALGGRPVLIARGLRDDVFEEPAAMRCVERMMKRGHVVALHKGTGEYDFMAYRREDAEKVARAYDKEKYFKVVKAAGKIG